MMLRLQGCGDRAAGLRPSGCRVAAIGLQGCGGRGAGLRRSGGRLMADGRHLAQERQRGGGAAPLEREPRGGEAYLLGLGLG